MSAENLEVCLHEVLLDVAEDFGPNQARDLGPNDPGISKMLVSKRKLCTSAADGCTT